MAYNKILTYLFQCRSEEFIEYFNQEGNDHCPYFILQLYSSCYALHVILEDEIYGWENHIKPTIEICRKGCSEILSYLATKANITGDYKKKFMDLAKSKYQWYEDDEDFDWMLHGDLETLKSKGYREIDCYLYEAGMKLHYEEVIKLLKQGADPYVFISADYLASEAEEYDYDTCQLWNELFLRVEDLFLCEDYGYVLEEGTKKHDVEISMQQIYSVYQAAAYQLMMNLITEFENAQE